MKVGRRGRG
uniref:Uncharacterized protein n=1 Tax=Anguilla anguilla TaxID=7936 RepID=A0A0E9VXL7_ANGAN